MSLDRCRIERQNHGIFAELSQGRKDRLPASALGPSIKPIIDRRVGTVFARAIAPTCAGLQHVDDAADDTSIVVAFRTRQSAGKMRPEPRPLTVVQPEQARSHCFFLRIISEKENHQSLIRYRP
jgi:hypothetical protein